MFFVSDRSLLRASRSTDSLLNEIPKSEETENHYEMISTDHFTINRVQPKYAYNTEKRVGTQV